VHLGGWETLIAVNSFVIVRETEEEAIQLWREIVGKADTEAVEGFGYEVQQAGKSSKEGQGMWANSKFEGAFSLASVFIYKNGNA
jgi:alkanesulfonate monooxygenase SsuD/methylene tetrahydromethanopterin reductase-like flavin-dependent oxidoreductase (luciferase family)